MQDPLEIDIQSEHNPVADIKTQNVGAGGGDFGVGAENCIVKRKRAPGGGRKSKKDDELYVPISIRIHPKALEWAKAEAERRGVGYQSIINEELLENLQHSNSQSET